MKKQEDTKLGQVLVWGLAASLVIGCGDENVVKGPDGASLKSDASELNDGGIAQEDQVAADIPQTDVSDSDVPQADVPADTTQPTCEIAACAAKLSLSPKSCRVASCAGDICAPADKPDGTQCNDGNACTQDSCKAGSCDGVPTKDCNCNTIGSSKDCEKLEDGDLCNGTLVCAAVGLYKRCTIDVSTVVKCPTDANTDCLANTCLLSNGQCKLAATNSGGVCDDGNKCTSMGNCSTDGQCTGVSGLPCDDKNPCTKDSCDPTSGCVHKPSGVASCDDGDSCTAEDSCVAGACKGKNTCCKNDADCLSQWDGNLCNKKPVCAKDAKGKKVCSYTKTPAVTCAPATGVQCQQNVCQPKTGKCTLAPATDGAACTNKQACGGVGVCSAGSCAKPSTPCDDGNPCTKDICYLGKSCLYEHLANGTACGPGKSCVVKVSTLTATDTPVPIPNNHPKGATSTILVAATEKPTRVRATLNYTNSNVVNTNLLLTHPTGKPVHGFSGAGATGKTASIAYDSQGTGSLSVIKTLVGLSPKGEWKLKVSDTHSSGPLKNDGQIVSWSVTLTMGTPLCK